MASSLSSAAWRATTRGSSFRAGRSRYLSVEAWARALEDLTDLAGPVPLPWTVRRANLLLEGVRLPRGKGGLVRVGPVLLEVTAQTYPCARMDQAHPGLLKALGPDWRGGVTTRVVQGGSITVGDLVTVERDASEHLPRLP